MSKCRKNTYTLKEAKEENTKRYFRNNGRGGSYYKCGSCGWYHMTRQRFIDKEGDALVARIRSRIVTPTHTSKENK